MGSRISEQKKLEWHNHFEAQKKSGLTKSKYCRLNNLSVDNFNYHLKKASEQAPTDKNQTPSLSGGDFISVVVEPSSDKTSPPIELVFEHHEQSLVLRVRWSVTELLEFINAWRAP